MICTDCGGEDPECFRCDGTGELCDRCGESVDACECSEEELEETANRLRDEDGDDFECTDKRFGGDE